MSDARTAAPIARFTRLCFNQFYELSLASFSSLHLACRRVCVTSVGWLLDCLRSGGPCGGVLPIGKIRFIDPHAVNYKNMITLCIEEPARSLPSGSGKSNAGLVNTDDSNGQSDCFAAS
jgi:hypothetical protein